MGQELERDRSHEARVFGLVDDAHAARAEQFDDSIVGDRVADLHVQVNGGAMLY